MNSQRRDSGTVAHELTQPELLQVLQNEHVLPLWDRYKSLNTIEPQFYEPMIWRWATMEQLIDRAARK